VISRVRGTLVHREVERVEVMTAAGVAYELEIPSTVYERLPKEGAEVELRAVLIVREDDQTLYGFLEAHERDVFRRLLTASGVGPRLALSMLSAMPPDRLVQAIATRDIASLRRVPGLGTKKAERLVLELADKLDGLAAPVGAGRPEGQAAQEAVGALVALGYPPAQAATAVRRALDDQPTLTGHALIKTALARVSA
jgi:holliday junction DNA helicase RuvA